MESQEEGHEDKKAGAPLLGRQAERVGIHKRRLWGHLVGAFQYLQGAYKRTGEQLFTRVCSDGTGVMMEKFRSDIRDD